MDRKTKEVELFGEKLILAERSVWDRRVADEAYGGIDEDTFATVSEKLAVLLLDGLKYNRVEYRSLWHVVWNFRTWQHNKRINELLSFKNIMALPFQTLSDMAWVVLELEGVEKPKKGVKPKPQKKKEASVLMSPKD